MTEKRFHRTAPNDLLRVGVITGPGGHTFNIWGEKMNAPGGAMRTTGMLMTHAWCLNPDFRQQFAEKYPQVVLVDDPREMVDHVDGVYVDDINAISLYPLLARPFLQAGVPTFVNRPFATSMAKGREMVETAQEHGTALSSASTWEFSEGAGDLRAKAADLIDAEPLQFVHEIERVNAGGRRLHSHGVGQRDYRPNEIHIAEIVAHDRFEELRTDT